MRFLVYLAVFATSLFAQSDWRFAHPDATLVGGFRPQSLLKSPLLASAIEEATKNEPSAAMMVGMASGLLGGITEIRFSVLDNGTPEPDVLAVVSGSLDESFMRSLAQDKAKWQRIDANTLLMGNGKSLERAVARMQSTGAMLHTPALEGSELLAGYDFWLAGSLPNTPMTGALKLNVKSLAFGMNLHDGVDMELTAQTATAAMAEALVKSAHEAEASQAQQLRGMLKSVVEGSTAHFRVSVPRDQVILAMKAQSANAAATTTQAAAPRPIAPAAPKRKTIIIEGLDNGPNEIPLTK